MEGDSDRLPAVVKVELGSLTLSSGRTQLGSWKLYSVKILDLGDRAVLSADGENVVLYLTEHSSFVGEVERFVEKPDDKRGRRRKRKQRRHPAFEESSETGQAVATTAPGSDPVTTTEAVEEDEKKEKRRKTRRSRAEAKVEEAPELPAPDVPPEPKESPGNVLRAKLAEKTAPVVADTKRFVRKVNPGRVAWGAAAVFVLSLIFIPQQLALVLAVVGMLAMAAGVIGYADNTIAARFPNRYPPLKIVLYGGITVLIGILVAVLR